MARLRIALRDQGLAADLIAVAGPPLAPGDAAAALAAAGVVHGIDDDALAAFATRLADAAFSGSATVARGVPPQPGADGRLEGAFLVPQQPGTQRPDGHMDWREREVLHPVRSGEVVATEVPPEPGIPGRSVQGAVLPARSGLPARQRMGPGIQSDGAQRFARHSGVIFATDRVLDVVPLHDHQADVDLTSGNLHTAGSLRVRGDVRDGCSVTATGDIEILGSVFDGTVTCDGSAHIAQGVLSAASSVRAGQDLRCRHAVAARLQAGATLVADDQLHHCTAAATRIVATTGRGTVVGGELRATQCIEVRVAGTPAGANTLLSVGDLLEERAELARLDAELSRLERTVVRGERTDRQTLAARKGPRLALRAGDQLQERRLSLLARQRALLKTAAIVVHDMLHQGVVVQFGNLFQPIVLPQGGVQLRFDSETNRIVPGRKP